jgi:hypothetical protein
MDSLPKESRIILALEAMKNKPELTLRRAAIICNVPLMTLSARRDGRPVRRDIIANSRKLTDLEEKTIIQYIIELCARAFHPRLCYMEDMANRLLRKRDAPPIGIRSQKIGCLRKTGVRKKGPRHS